MKNEISEVLECGRCPWSRITRSACSPRRYRIRVFTQIVDSGFFLDFLGSSGVFPGPLPPTRAGPMTQSTRLLATVAVCLLAATPWITVNAAPRYEKKAFKFQNTSRKLRELRIWNSESSASVRYNVLLTKIDNFCGRAKTAWTFASFFHWTDQFRNRENYLTSFKTCLKRVEHVFFSAVRRRYPRLAYANRQATAAWQWAVMVPHSTLSSRWEDGDGIRKNGWVRGLNKKKRQNLRS